MAMVHGDHDGRAPEGTVSGGENVGVRRTHRVEVGVDTVPVHETELIEVVTLRLLADRGDHHAAGNVVLRPFNRDGPSAAVLFRFPHLGDDAT